MLRVTLRIAIVLAVVFGVWFAVERTLSIHTIVTTRREGFYWLAILFTFALGTAASIRDLICSRDSIPPILTLSFEHRRTKHVWIRWGFQIVLAKSRYGKFAWLVGLEKLRLICAGQLLIVDLAL